MIAFLAISALVICTPGQDTVLTVRNTIAGGRSSGIATAAGVAGGQAVWTLATSLGVVAVLAASEPAFRVMRLAGAGYLVVLGIGSICTALRPGAARAVSRHQAARASRAKALRQGVVSNIGNPKMAVFFASLLPQFAGGGASFLRFLALGLTFCLLTFGWLSLYAVAVAKLGRAFAGRARRAIDVVTGSALVLLGLRLAAEPTPV